MKNLIKINNMRKTTVLALVVITVALVLLWAVPPAQAATQTDVAYVDAAGNPQTVPTATVLGGSETTLTTGWYLAEGTPAFDHSLTVSGNVNLILADSCIVTIDGSFNNAGINVLEGNSLTIYGQSYGTGTLDVSGGSNSAGIGGGDGGNITINGGNVHATGGIDGAGIGGGDGGNGGNITINGGDVTAIAGTSGAGIGGGREGDGGNITINGGIVNAYSNVGGAGIGGGTGGSGGNITINGGDMTISGGNNGAGIGGGSGGDGGNIVIGGGGVSTNGGYSGAGIGGGSGGRGGNITIAGGTVAAFGGDGFLTLTGGGAGIGSGGSGGESIEIGTITIADSANVTAQGGTSSSQGDGANIGFGGGTADGAAVQPGTNVTYHTVTITPTSNGVIAALPGGATDSVQVPDGANQTFTFTPNSGGELVSISVDGSDADVADSHTIFSITSDMTIAAVFESAPDPPTNVTATAGNGQASVSFTAPANDGGSAITGYTVTSAPGGITATGTSSPISVTGLTNGTAYTFTVTATNEIGTSVQSAPSGAVTPSTSPDAPTNVQATAGNGQASVSFTAPANNGGSMITGYTVTSSPDNKTATGTASPITVTGLTNGTAYTFTVTATNSAGTSVASAPSGAVTPIASPDAPTNVQATAGDGQASVSFIAPANNGGSTITGYTVTSSPDGKTATGTSSPITVTGLTNGTAYTFTVTATNSAGTGVPSAPSGAVTPSTSPDAPTNVQATAGNGQAVVSFVAPANNGGSAITGYTVTSDPGGITATRISSPITVTGLTNGTEYTFTVTATNSAGTSPASDPSEPVTPSASSPPGPGPQTYFITATADANSSISPSGTVTVQSGGSRTFTFSAAAGYHISSVTVNGDPLTQGQIGLGSFTFTNVTASQTIDVKSAPGASFTLEITVSGGGHAEYSINGANFAVYTTAVTILSSDNVTVKAVADSGYRFDRWETPSANTSSQMDLGTITGSVHLSLYFTAEGSSPSGQSNNNILLEVSIVIIIVVLAIIAVWYLVFLRMKR